MANNRTIVAGPGISVVDDPDAGTLTISSTIAQTDAPTDAKYVVSEQHQSLTNERVLTSGTGISVIDNPEDGTIVISSTVQSQAPSSAPYIVSQVTNLPNSRVIIAGPGINIKNDQENGTLIVSVIGIDGEAPAAPSDASYIVVNNATNLTNERRLIAGNGIEITDDQTNGQIIVSVTAQPTAPPNASYITITPNQDLTSERVLTAGSGIAISDGGPGGPLTISSTIPAVSGDADASYVVLSATGSLTNERVLTAGSGIAISDGGPGGPLTISTGLIDSNNVSFVTPYVTGSVSVNVKLREYVSVKDFGAKGDGVTNDTVAIQSCLDYCFEKGKTVFIPTGTYNVHASLVVLWGMTIIGEPGSVIKRANIVDTAIYQTMLASQDYINYINLPSTPETNLLEVLFRNPNDFLSAGNPTGTPEEQVRYKMWKLIRDNMSWRLMTTMNPIALGRKMWADSTNNGGPKEDSPILRICGITFDGNYQGQGTPNELNFSIEQQHNIILAGSFASTYPYGVAERHRLRVIIEDCVFKNAAGDGCAVYTSTDVTIQNCHFWENYRSGPSILSMNNVVRWINLTTGGAVYNSPPQVESVSPVDGISNNILEISNCYFDTVKNQPLTTSSMGPTDIAFDVKGPNKLLASNTIFNAGLLLMLGSTGSYGTFNNCIFRQIDKNWSILINRPGMLKFSGCEFILPIAPETQQTFSLGGSPPRRTLVYVKSYTNEPDQAECMIDFDNCTFSLDKDPLSGSLRAAVSTVTMGTGASSYTALITTTTNHGFDGASGFNTLNQYETCYVKLDGFTNPLYNKAYKVTAITANTIRIKFSEKFADNFSFTPGSAWVTLVPDNWAVQIDTLTGSYVSFNSCHFGKFTNAIYCARTKEVIVKNNHFNSFAAMNVSSYSGNEDLGSINIKFSGNTFGSNFSALGHVDLVQSGGKVKLSFHNQEIPAHVSSLHINGASYLTSSLIVSGSRVLTSHNKPWEKYQTLPGDVWKMNYAEPGQPNSYRASYPSWGDAYLTSSWYPNSLTITSGETSQRPTLTTVDQGSQFLDKTLAANGKPIWWTGTKWVDSLGNEV